MPNLPPLGLLHGAPGDSGRQGTRTHSHLIGTRSSQGRAEGHYSASREGAGRWRQVRRLVGEEEGAGKGVGQGSRAEGGACPRW